MKEIKGVLEKYSNGIGYIKKLDDEIYGSTNPIGEYTVVVLQKGYAMQFEGDSSVEFETKNELLSFIDSLFIDDELIKYHMRNVRLEENIKYKQEDLNDYLITALNHHGALKFNDDEKHELVYHMNEYKLNPVISRIFSNKECMLEFFIEDNHIYKRESHVDRRVYLGNIEFGEFCFLSNGKIVMFELGIDSLNPIKMTDLPEF